MEKKAFPEKFNEKESAGSGGSSIGANIKSKVEGFSHWLFGMTKFLMGILLLPFVYSATTIFFKELGLIEKPLQNYFWAGIITLLVIHLLVWEPAPIYSKGHKILEAVFNFFKPLVKVAPYVLPIYTIVLFVLYILLALFIKSPDLINYFVFLFGFSVSLHLVFSAKTLRSKKEDFLKGNYIFGFSFVYIINVMIVASFLSILCGKFSFMDFCNQSFLTAKGIYLSAFKQLFVMPKA